MTTAWADKQADLAGPGIGNCAELGKILPQDWASRRTVEASRSTKKETIVTLESSHTELSTQEKLHVTGSQLLEHAKRLLHAGNIRRIVISQEGRTIAEFSLTIGVVGAMLAPVCSGGRAGRTHFPRR